MPGAYTHITVVNLAAERRRLQQVDGFPPEAIVALSRFRGVAELGAVSPDYAYLHIGDKVSQHWADLMHFHRTDGVVRAAIPRVRALEGAQQELVFAWVLGYVAHMTMDVTLHPCINLKVGPYADNKREHRVCEMNQDVHAFRRLNLGRLDLAERIKGGIRRSTAPDGGLAPEIKQPWEGALREAYPVDFERTPPQFDEWHRGFVLSVDKLAEEHGWLVPLSRHVLGYELGVSYPADDQVDPQFIENLPTPNGPMHFDALLDRMVNNVVGMWTVVARAIYAGDNSHETRLADWNLDTGERQDVAGRPLVFWS